ncbi:hypothetical protein [Fusibacter ferrireducens]|uniref:Uncharacterized protein n=1 Tax=Fusibacter ferrireducens TaxID=2785058 RepID=A0ABR9ZVL7_9FIRM|nr:hypothetical protein [Fusibacter ferrireducens]MBF4694513.1 hypothetical protein [Fusibacter ferrireducens]
MFLKKWGQKLYIECLIIFVFLSDLAARIPSIDQLNDWCTTPYVFTYQYGIHSRYLVGSLFNLLLNPISIKRLYFFILLSIIILIILFAYFLGQILRRAQSEYRTAALIFMALFWASPFSISFLFYWGNYGRLDLYLLISALLSLILIPVPKWRWFTPALLLIGMATHQVFIFTYCFIILGALFIEAVEKHFDLKSSLLLTVSLVVTSASFLYFQFYSSATDFINAEAVLKHFSAKSNIPVNQKMIEFEYFKTITDHLSEFVANGLWDRIYSGITILILLSPVIILLFKLWQVLYEKATCKWGYALLMCIPFTSMPAFMLTIDWGRWFSAVFITQFCLFFYMLYRKHSGAIYAFKKLQSFILKNRVLTVCLILYLTTLGKFEAAGLLTYANRIVMFVKTLF